MIKAVGFDLDGTFLSTRVDYPKLRTEDLRVMERHGIPCREIFGDSPGPRLRRTLYEWMKQNGRGDEFRSLNEEIDRALTEIETEFVDSAVPFPGSAEAPGILHSMGLKTGLLTRGSRRYAVRALTVTGTADGFDVVMGRDHTCFDDAKPSPRAIADFSALLGVRPDELLYIGDNITDYRAAHDAGAAFAGVLTGNGSEELWRNTDESIIILKNAGDCVKLFRNRGRSRKDDPGCCRRDRCTLPTEERRSPDSSPDSACPRERWSNSSRTRKRCDR